MNKWKWSHKTLQKFRNQHFKWNYRFSGNIICSGKESMSVKVFKFNVSYSIFLCYTMWITCSVMRISVLLYTRISKEHLTNSVSEKLESLGELNYDKCWMHSCAPWPNQISKSYATTWDWANQLNYPMLSS